MCFVIQQILIVCNIFFDVFFRYAFLLQGVHFGAWYPLFILILQILYYPPSEKFPIKLPLDI